MAISIGRLSGGNTPADGSDPRTFPAIWNATADTLEGLSNTVDGLEVGDLADATVTSPSFGQPLTYDPVSEQWVNDSGNYPVMVFADSTARSSAIPTPSEGMITYLEDTDAVEKYDGSAFVNVSPGGLVAVKDVLKTDTFSVSLSAGANTTVTGLSIDHALSDAGNKLLLYASVNGGREFGYAGLAFSADGTLINVGDAASSRISLHSTTQTNDSNVSPSLPMSSSYSPGTTSTITYAINVFNLRTVTDTYYINRSPNDTNAVTIARASSSFILMEVAV